LIADTVKIPLIGSHVFGLGDKAHRNGARIGELHFAGAIGKQSVSWLTSDTWFGRRRMTAAQFAFERIKPIEQRPPERSLAQGEMKRTRITAEATRTK
jgi:hypothetical protein